MARLSPIRPISYAAALGLALGLGGVAIAQTQPAAPKTESGAPVGPPSARPSEPPGAGAEHDLVGLDVFSSDGTKVGQVRAVTTGASGDVVSLLVRSGGFLGFGGRTIAIPQGHFTRTGPSVRLSLDSDQVKELPEIKE